MPVQKVFLVAPLVGHPETARRSGIEDGRSTAGAKMRSRDSFWADDLEQASERIADVWEGHAGPAGVAAVRLQDIRLVRLDEQSILTASALVDRTLASAGVLENMLTTAVEQLVAETWLGARVHWVNRTLVAANAQDAGDWMLCDADNQQVDISARSARRVLTLGWGNNLLEIAEAVDEALESQLLAGLVDAQFIWVQLDAIAVSSGDFIKAYSGGRREVLQGRRSAEMAGQLSRQMARHHLFYDKVLLHLQGVRGSIARSALHAWRYPDTSRRILHRVREIDHLVQQESESGRRRYQELVENALLALGVIALVQLVIALIQIAYTGGVVPAGPGNARFSLLSLLKAANTDGVIVTSMVMAVALFAWIVWHKRRS